MEVLIRGEYESDKCPSEMIAFNVALGATMEEATKKAVKMKIQFQQIDDSQWIRDSQWIMNVWVFNSEPPAEHCFVFRSEEPQQTFRNGKPVQVVYSLASFGINDSVATIKSCYKGVDNDLKYEVEYNFVEEGLLVICKTKDIVAKRWCKRIR